MIRRAWEVQDRRGQNDQASQKGQSQEQGSNTGIGGASRGFQNRLLECIEFSEFFMDIIILSLFVNIVNRIYVLSFLRSNFFLRVNSAARSTVAKIRLL